MGKGARFYSKVLFLLMVLILLGMASCRTAGGEEILLKTTEASVKMSEETTGASEKETKKPETGMRQRSISGENGCPVKMNRHTMQGSVRCAEQKNMNSTVLQGRDPKNIVKNAEQGPRYPSEEIGTPALSLWPGWVLK